jgi:hypothetical protein
VLSAQPLVFFTTATLRIKITRINEFSYFISVTALTQFGVCCASRTSDCQNLSSKNSLQILPSSAGLKNLWINSSPTPKIRHNICSNIIPHPAIRLHVLLKFLITAAQEVRKFCAKSINKQITKTMNDNQLE